MQSRRANDEKGSQHDCQLCDERRALHACCIVSELPLAFMAAPCGVNEKRFIKPLLDKVKGRGLSVKTLVAGAQCDSAEVREMIREFGAEPVTPYRKSSRIKHALKVGRDFVAHARAAKPLPVTFAHITVFALISLVCFFLF